MTNEFSKKIASLNRLEIIGEIENWILLGNNASDVLTSLYTKEIINYKGKDINYLILVYRLCEQSGLYKKIYNLPLCKGLFNYEEASDDMKKLINEFLSRKLLPVWYKIKED